MLNGIDPLLSGELLLHLDAMGHSDAVIVADAHFPARRLAKNYVELPGTTVTDVVRAIRSVLPLDGDAPLDLMATAKHERLPIHDELIAAARIENGEPRFVDRFDYYELAEKAYLIVRTGEQRVYANALLRKGIAIRQG